MNQTFLPFFRGQNRQRSEIATLKAQLEQKDTLLDHAMKSLAEQTEQYEETLNKIKEQSEANFKEIARENTQLREERETLRGQVADRDERLKLFEQEINRLNQQVLKLEADLKAARSHKKRPVIPEQINHIAQS